MNISGIYKIVSKMNPERVYIGSSINIYFRWKKHLSDLRKNKHGSIKLQRHFNKYGEADLVFVVIEPCFIEFLLDREQYYINQLNPYFNVCRVAGRTVGREISKETRHKMSTSKLNNKNSLGFKHTEETKAKWRVPRSKETLQKMKDAKQNISKETRKKMSDGQKRRQKELRAVA